MNTVTVPFFRPSLLAAVALAIACASVTRTEAANAAPPDRMSYQGFLVDDAGTPIGATPINREVVFRVFDALEGGNLIWAERQIVTINRGYFNVMLGEGSAVGGEPHGLISDAFIGPVSERYMETTVVGLTAGPDTPITPRVKLLSSPFAFLSKRAVNADFAQQLVNTGNTIDLSNPFSIRVNSAIQTAGGDPRGNGAVDLQVGRPDADRVAAGTESVVSGGGNNRAGGNHSAVGGGANNIANGAGAAIAGGAQNAASGQDSAIGGGLNNVASGLRSTVSGGHGNQATHSESTVGGGLNNLASGLISTVGGGNSNEATGTDSTVAGGLDNGAQGNQSFVGGGHANNARTGHSVIGGGQYNEARDFGYATIGGGRSNVVSGAFATVGGGNGNFADHDNATVAGGWLNRALGTNAAIAGGVENTVSGSFSGFIGGGFSNEVTGLEAAVAGGTLNKSFGARGFVGGGINNQATGDHASIAGGDRNVASGLNAAVPGGFANTASGSHSLAMGRRAKATHDGSFVFADLTDADFGSQQANEFSVRASRARFHVSNYVQVQSSGIGTEESNTGEARNVRLYFLLGPTGQNTPTWVVSEDVQRGNLMFNHYGIDPSNNNPWHAVVFSKVGDVFQGSDRKIKKDIRPVKNMLEKAKSIEAVRYRLRGFEEEAGDQVGVIAQDVQKEFPELVTENAGILAVNYPHLSAVAIGAVKELDEEKDREVADLRQENAEIKQQMSDLLQRLQALESKVK